MAGVIQDKAVGLDDFILAAPKEDAVMRACVCANNSSEQYNIIKYFSLLSK